MNEVRTWLERIGLARYVDAFEANEIDMGLLKQVDDQMLKDIGVAAAGHRLRLRNAIAELAQSSAVDVKASGGVAPPEAPTISGERRHITVMFSDLVGSTALSARMDPEDLREAFRLIRSALPKRCAASPGSSQNSWATASSCTSAILRPTRTTPSGQYGRGLS